MWQINMKHLRENIHFPCSQFLQGSAETLIRWGGKL